MPVYRTLSKDHMHLYRHSTRCPSAMQMFLDENPRYWRFVPMTEEEATQRHQMLTTSSVDVKSSDIRDDGTVQLFMKNVPLPPKNYRFSPRQYHVQYTYFQAQRDLLMPSHHLDLYNARVIGVSKCAIVVFVLLMRIYMFSNPSARNRIDSTSSNC